jgi:hypothetical protein
MTTARWCRPALAIVGLIALVAGVAVSSRTASAATLPSSVEAAVRAAAQADAGASSVTIVRAEAVTWTDGCLGIYPPGVACTLALVNGYVAWVTAGSTGYRYHTNLDGSSVQLAATVPPSSIASAPLPGGASPRVIDGGLISGEVPAPGSIGLLVLLRPASPEAVSGELLTRGCAVETLATLEGGVWRIWILGAPAAANAGFPASALGTLTPFFVRCAPATPPPGSGVLGIVTRGPLCPVQQLGVPCPDQPYSATLTVLDSSNVEVARATSGTDGRYAIALAAGSYTMVPLSPPGVPFPFAGPVAFEVQSGRWLTLDISYDTGIR